MTDSTQAAVVHSDSDAFITAGSSIRTYEQHPLLDPALPHV
jgi:hypothetical protein